MYRFVSLSASHSYVCFVFDACASLPSFVLPFLSLFHFLHLSCRRCGVVLPREVRAIEAHDNVCAGYNEAKEEEPDLRSAVTDYSHEDLPDALQADNVTIADAFVCPMCFEAFPDQVGSYAEYRHGVGRKACFDLFSLRVCLL